MTQPSALRTLLFRILAAAVVSASLLRAQDNPDPPPSSLVTIFQLRQLVVGTDDLMDPAFPLPHRASYIMEPDRTGQIKLEVTLAHDYTGTTSCDLFDNHGTRLHTFGTTGTSSFAINVGLFHPPFHLCFINPDGNVVEAKSIVPRGSLEGEDGTGFMGTVSSSGGGLPRPNPQLNLLVADTDGTEGDNGEDGTGSCGASSCSACDLTGGGDPERDDDLRVTDIDGPDTEDDGQFGITQQAGSSANGDSHTSLAAVVDPSAGISLSDFRVHGNGDANVTRSGGATGDITSVETDTAYSKLEAVTVGGKPGVKIRQWKTAAEAVTSAAYREVIFAETADNEITRTSTYDGLSINTVWRFVAGTQNMWELTTGNGLRREEVIREDFGTDPTKIVVRTRKFERSATTSGGANELVSDTRQTYTKYLFGWKKTKLEVIGLTGNQLVSEWQYFDGNVTTGGTSKNGRGLLSHYVRPDGFEISYNYTEASSGARPFTRTANSSPLNGSDAVQEQTSSNSGGTSTTWTMSADLMVEGSSETTVNSDNTFNIAAYNGSGGVVDTTGAIYAFGSDQGGTPQVVKPQGAATFGETTTYSRSGGFLTITHRKGGMASNVVTDGTQTQVIVDSDGVVISRIVSDIPSNIVLELANVVANDTVGRPTQIDYFTTTTGPLWSELMAYNCCGLSSFTDRDGIVTTYGYDALHRQTSSVNRGITTQTVYDGLKIHTKRSTSAFGSHEIENVERNLAGTEVIQRSVSPQNGNLVETKTKTIYRNPAGVTPNPDSLPSGIGRRVERELPLTADDVSVPAKETTDYFCDGRPYQTIGNLGTNLRHSYSMEPYDLDGSSATADVNLLTQTSYRLDGTTLRESSVSRVDWRGRTVASAGFGDGEAKYFYDDADLLVKKIDADGVATLYGYNARHERTEVALDLNGNGAINHGIDQVSFSETKPINDGVRDLIRTTKKVWKPYSGTGLPVEVVVSRDELTPDGLHSWSRSFPTTGSGFGVSHTQRTVGSGGDWAITTVNKDGTISSSYYDNGYLVANTFWALGSTPPATAPSNIMSVSTSGFVAGTAYGYDALGRATTTTDSRTGTVTNNRHATDSGFRDEVLSVTDAGSRTTAYTYDHRGRTKSVDKPDTPNPLGGNFTNIVTTTHYPNDSVKVVDGSTYKTSYTYDYADRMASMTTYGTSTSTTTWTYDGNGRLLQKFYPDGPDTGSAADPGPSYTYTSAGRVKKRIWGSGKTTRFDYVAGRLYAKRYFTSSTSQTTIDASTVGNDSSTPDLTYTLDSLDRVTAVARGTSAHFSYTYDPDELGLLTETQTDALAAPRLLTRKRDGILRSSGYLFGTSAVPNAISEVSYGYDTAGRFKTVTYQRIPDEDDHPAAQTFTYDYEYDVASASHVRHGSGSAKPALIPFGMDGPRHSVTKMYHATRNALQSINNFAGADNPSSFDYNYNALGQRAGVGVSSDFSANSEWVGWEYDARGQLVSSDSTAGTGSGTSDDRYYEYDGIGNRVKSRTGTATSSGGTETIYYADADASSTGANGLNQYGSIVTGSNTSDPIYDTDGNLVDDSVAWEYLWDGENRMISATPKVPTSGTKVGYVYDYLGRLCTRRFFNWNAGNSSWDAGENYRYVYDGWNRIESHLDWNLLQDEYVWGLDLSGTRQGAGGVGGMLQWVTSYDSGSRWNNYYPLYDGNGNVTELLDDAGEVKAHWEYDPFGNTLRTSSAVAWYDPVNLFEFRFSTKPQDRRTALYYYGHRFYDPVTGRWPSRDSIEERGGVNLYAFNENEPVSRVDRLGMQNIIIDGLDGAKTKGMEGRREQNRLQPKRDELEKALAKRREGAGCCSDTKIEEGFQQLKRDFERSWQSMRDSGIYSQFDYEKDTDASSCYGQASRAMGAMGANLIPPCWECNLVNGTKTNFWTRAVGDHWWIECRSYNKDGNQQKRLVFDAYYDRSGVDPSEIEKMYPDRQKGNDGYINEFPPHASCDGSKVEK